MGLNAAFFITQFVWLCAFATWLALAVVALTQLRRAPLQATPKALWALIIVLVPLLGAVAF